MPRQTGLCAPSTALPPTDCRSAVNRRLSAAGLPTAAVNIIAASWKSSTTNNYSSVIRQWYGFCDKEWMDSSCPTVSTLIAFLTHLFNKGIGFSQINTACSAISVLYSLSGPCLGDDPLVSRFMRGVRNLRRPQPKYPILWD